MFHSANDIVLQGSLTFEQEAASSNLCRCSLSFIFRKFEADIGAGTNAKQSQESTIKIGHREIVVDVNHEDDSKEQRPNKHLKPMKGDEVILTQEVVHYPPPGRIREIAFLLFQFFNRLHQVFNFRFVQVERSLIGLINRST